MPTDYSCTFHRLPAIIQKHGTLSGQQNVNDTDAYHCQAETMRSPCVGSQALFSAAVTGRLCVEARKRMVEPLSDLTPVGLCEAEP